MIQLDFILLLCSLKGFIFVTSPVIVCQLAISFRNSCLKNRQQKQNDGKDLAQVKWCRCQVSIYFRIYNTVPLWCHFPDTPSQVNTRINKWTGTFH